MRPSERKAVIVLTNAGSGFGLGETPMLFERVTARALDLTDPPDPGAGWRKAGFAVLAIGPLLFAAGMAGSWHRRAELRRARGIAAAAGLWLPLALALGLAWSLLVAIPAMHGTPFAALRVFRPDVALLLTATAATAVLWALLRIVLAKLRPLAVA